MSKQYTKRNIALSAIFLIIISATASSLVTYTVIKPDPDHIDPRCDKVFIEKSTGGDRQCNEAREQREWLKYEKNANNN